MPVRTAEQARHRGQGGVRTDPAQAPGLRTHEERTRVPACAQPGSHGGAGLLSRATCKALIYLDWNNLSVAVILTTSVLRSQSGAVLIEAFMSSHKSSKMKTQGPLKYTPWVCAVQLEAFMTPVRAFMTL